MEAILQPVTFKHKAESSTEVQVHGVFTQFNQDISCNNYSFSLIGHFPQEQV